MPREPRIVYGPVPNRNPVDTWTPKSMLDPQWVDPGARPPATETYEPSQTDEETGVKPIRPDHVPLPQDIDISERGGPIDKINEALRKPWNITETTSGRPVNTKLCGPSPPVIKAVMWHYQDAGWIVELVKDPPESYLMFRLPKDVQDRPPMGR